MSEEAAVITLLSESCGRAKLRRREQEGMSEPDRPARGGLGWHWCVGPGVPGAGGGGWLGCWGVGATCGGEAGVGSVVVPVRTGTCENRSDVPESCHSVGACRHLPRDDPKFLHLRAHL